MNIRYKLPDFKFGDNVLFKTKTTPSAVLSVTAHGKSQLKLRTFQALDIKSDLSYPKNIFP